MRARRARGGGARLAQEARLVPCQGQDRHTEEVLQPPVGAGAALQAAASQRIFTRVLPELMFY